MITRPHVLFVVLALGMLTASPLAAQTIDWSRQLGTSRWDESHGVSADGLGNLFISGSTNGDLGGTNASREDDAFVSKYDTHGNLLWTEQLGTSHWDESHGVSADGLGNVFISGGTSGDLGGTNAGRYDAFVSKYDTHGNHLWTEQLGTSSSDYSWGVSADGLGNLFLTGSSDSDLGGTSAGGKDAFVVKLTDETFVPEPATCGMLLSVLFSFAAVRNRSVRS